MPNLNPTQPGYNTQAAQPQRPVSPFDRSTGTAPAGPGATFSPDQVQSQPVRRGIEPNIGLLKDKQAIISPFHRAEGQSIDYLAAPPVQAPGAKPGATQPSGPQPIVFTLPKDIPEGPAIANIQQLVLQEVEPVKQPQEALQLIAAHADQARGSRETANRFTWGARYYAVQAAELAEQTVSQWGQMNDGQKQIFMSKVQEYRDQSISMLNTAKQHSITTYNEALKSNLVYNHFFTSTGPMIKALDDQSMQVVKAEIDDAWSRWNGSFEKEWQGQNTQAKGILMVMDETTAEVTQHLHRMNSAISQLN